MKTKFQNVRFRSVAGTDGRRLCCRSLGAIGILLPLIFLVPGADAQRAPLPFEFQRIAASDASAGARFGHAIAILDSTTFVGAPLASAESGEVYVFELGRDGLWTETQRLEPSDRADGARFGWSVSARGDSLLVGAPGAADERGVRTGAAYLFERQVDGRWHEVERLVPENATDSSQFGWSVAIRNGWTDDLPYGPLDWLALVGAPAAANSGGVVSGLTFFYEWPGGEARRETVFAPPVASSGDQFGWSVALGPRVGVIGAPGVSREGGATGGAYVVQKDELGSWSITENILPPCDSLLTIPCTGRIGSAVGVGRHPVVGAPSDAGGVGAVLHFVPILTEWHFAGSDQDPREPGVGSYGSALAAESWLVAGDGAAGKAGAGIESVATYFLSAVGLRFHFHDVLSSPDEAAGDGFGEALATHGDLVAVGAPLSSAAAPGAGAVYIYEPIFDTGAGEDPGAPEGHSIVDAFPNPASGILRLQLVMPARGPLRIRLFDMQGREVLDSVRWQSQGPNELTFDVSHLPPGVYAYEVTAGVMRRVGLITVVR